MSRPIQNVLARDSKGNIAYLCSKCGKEVKKEAIVCDNCGARLGKIRCPFCNYAGGVDDFRMDTCPRCGRKSSQDNKSNREKTKNIIKNHIGLSTKLFWILFIILTASILFLVIVMLRYFEFI